MNYYIDINELELFIQTRKEQKNETELEKELREIYEIDDKGKKILVGCETITKEIPVGGSVNSIKYDLIMSLLGTIFQQNEEIDTTLGIERALQNNGLALSLAFNTLTKYNIIKVK